MMVSGIVGARIAYVIEHWRSEFAGNLLEIIRVDHGGLMFYGGLVLAVAVFFAYTIAKRLPLTKTADLFTVLIPLGHAFGRIGCFFNGCCYGRRCDAFGVAFPIHSPAWYEQVDAGLIASSAAKSLPVIPVQLIEASGCLLIAVALVLFFIRRYPLNEKAADVKGGAVAGAYLIGYATLRFALEFLRGDLRAAVGPFSIAQAISIALVALGFAFLASSRVKREADHE